MKRKKKKRGGYSSDAMFVTARYDCQQRSVAIQIESVRQVGVQDLQSHLERIVFEKMAPIRYRAHIQTAHETGHPILRDIPSSREKVSDQIHGMDGIQKVMGHNEAMTRSKKKKKKN